MTKEPSPRTIGETAAAPMADPSARPTEQPQVEPRPGGGFTFLRRPFGGPTDKKTNDPACRHPAYRCQRCKRVICEAMLALHRKGCP